MHTIQYTIRNIPPAVDQVIRKRARQQGNSFNQTVVDLLSLQVLGTTKPDEDQKFDWLFNQSTLDKDFDQAIEELSQVDGALWGMIASSFIVDTSAYSGFNRGDQRLRKWFDTKNNIFIPLIVVGELRAGFSIGSRTTENEHLLQRFLDSRSVQTLPLTLKTTQKFALLFSQLRKAGTAISTNDLWIAALALEHNLPILTLDTDFRRIKGMKILPLAPKKA